MLCNLQSSVHRRLQRTRKNLPCWKGAVDNKPAIRWVAGTFPVFLVSPDAATLKIMHDLKEAKCSGKMPCLLSEWFKYPSKMYKILFSQLRISRKKNCVLRKQFSSPEHESVKYLYHSYGTALWCEIPRHLIKYSNWVTCFFILVLFPYCALFCITCIHSLYFLWNSTCISATLFSLKL